MPEVIDQLATPYLKKPSEESLVILLIDDQQIIAESLKRMVEDQEHIELHYCSDPTQALPTALSVKPALILQDLVMPEIDGLTLVKFFRANPETKNIPIIVLSSKEEPTTKAQAFEVGATDYIVKFPDKVELLARIRHHSEAYIHLLQRNEAYQELQESQKQIQNDLDEAAAYVHTLLPKPLEGDISTSWVYVPSSQLGGDAFGYHWVDKENLALYLLDVCGHGVGAALLSITITHVLGAKGMLNADLLRPATVLDALNQAFPMEQHGERFFTIWYGVYNTAKRELTYSSGGHPPALLITNKKELKELRTGGFLIGGDLDQTFEEASCQVPKESELYLYSDGVYELRQKEGSEYTLNEFISYIQQGNPTPSVEDLFSHAQLISGEATFDDDFSALKVAFS